MANKLDLGYTRTEFGFVNEYYDLDEKKWHVCFNIGNSKASNDSFDNQSDADTTERELINELYELTEYLEEV